MSGHRTYVTVVRGGGQVLVFLAGEDVDGNKVALCVAVLASLRRGNVSNLPHITLSTRSAEHRTQTSQLGVAWPLSVLLPEVSIGQAI